MIDGRVSRGFWPFLEQLFAQLGLRLAVDVLSVLGNINFEKLRPPIGQFLNQFVGRIVIVVDNFDDLLDSNGVIFDRDLDQLLAFVLSKETAKLILSSKADYVPRALQETGTTGLMTKVRMGRYGTDQTVINVLDDHFNRGKAKLDEYPEKLIQAIDRHPLVAALAAQILGRSGPSILFNEQFISELRQQLRSELFRRLIDDQSLPAVELSSKLRTAVPISMLEHLVSSDSIHRARTGELLYSVPDRRWQELIASLGLFRRQSVEEMRLGSLSVDLETEEKSDHTRIADAYYRIFRADDDPKWIRESYFHRMLSGSVKRSNLPHFVGTYYVPELISSAHYCFRKADYLTALELFEAAKSLSEMDETSKMWYASCLIRGGKPSEGETEYKSLVAQYPSNIGIRTSHVDALLSIHDEQAAIDTLQKYELQPDRSDWIAQEWGRAHLGLHHYKEAIDIFSNLVSHGGGNPYAFTYLARALRQFGDLVGAIEVLRRATKIYPENVSILTSLGIDLEQARLDEEALEILLPLFERASQNTRAALAIVRLRLREGNIREAERVVAQAKADLPSSMRPFLISAEAEVLIAQGRPGSAIDFLRPETAQDEHLIGLFLESFIQVITKSSEPEVRDRAIKEALLFR
jgi:tetratricopeptide (TPR) repeat protein